MPDSSIGVYSITCKAKGKTYIGQSKNVARRLASHQSLLRQGKHPKAALQFDYDAYGTGAFVFEVITICSTLDQAIQLERELIERNKNLDATYNVANVPRDESCKYVSRSYYLPRHVMQWLDLKAEAEKRSASYYLTELLERQMNREQPAPVEPAP